MYTIITHVSGASGIISIEMEILQLEIAIIHCYKLF